MDSWERFSEATARPVFALDGDSSTTQSSSWCWNNSAPNRLSAAVRVSLARFSILRLSDRTGRLARMALREFSIQASGQDPGWANLSPHLALRRIPASSADTVHGAIQLQHSRELLAKIWSGRSDMSDRRDIGYWLPMTSTLESANLFGLSRSANDDPTSVLSRSIVDATKLPAGHLEKIVIVFTFQRVALPPARVVHFLKRSNGDGHTCEYGRWFSGSKRHQSCRTAPLFLAQLHIRLTGANCDVASGTPDFHQHLCRRHHRQLCLQLIPDHAGKAFLAWIAIAGAYTFSKSLDQASSFEETLNPFNPRASRALSLFNSAQRFVINYYWELPVPKYQRI